MGVGERTQPFHVLAACAASAGYVYTVFLSTNQGGFVMGLSLALLGVLALFALVGMYKLMLLRTRTLYSTLPLDTGGTVHSLLFPADGEVIFPRKRPLSVQPFSSERLQFGEGGRAHSREHRRHRGRHCWRHRWYGCCSLRFVC